MKVRWNRRRFAQALVFLVVVFGAVTPAAAGSPDAIGRWLAGHDGATSSAGNPVSDVVSSLQVARAAGLSDQTPVSDLASSLGLNQAQLDRMIANAPWPTSDTADSLAVARQAAAASTGLIDAPAGFAWHDAGIGAGAALLFVAMGACSLLLLRRHRRLAA